MPRSPQPEPRHVPASAAPPAGFVQLTAAELAVSPLNVRQCDEDAEDTAGLEASILQFGLIHPLIAHPLTSHANSENDENAAFSVLAGGRRLRAIRRLIAARRIEADWPVPVIVRDIDAAQIVELSLHENLTARSLRPWEESQAVIDAASRGVPLAEIARHFVQPLVWAQRHARLGRLAPPLLDAWRAGKLSEDLARAYASTEDTRLQLAVWDELSRRESWQHTPEVVRRRIDANAHELERQLKFVSAAAYRCAGGRFELDLFSDDPDQRGRIADPGILARLVAERTEALREDVRGELGRPDLRFIAERPRHSGNNTDYALKLGDDDDRHAPGVVAFLDIDAAGVARTEFWWENRAAKAAAAPDAPKRADLSWLPDDGQPDRYTNAAQQANAIARDEHGLTQAGLAAIRELRREIMRALLIQDAALGSDLARDWLTWSQLRIALHVDSERTIGARGLASHQALQSESADRHFLAAFFEDLPANEIWAEALLEVEQAAWMAREHPAGGFNAYRHRPAEEKRRAEAVLAGLSLLPSASTPGWRFATHDMLMLDAIGADPAPVRAVWRPTAMFVGLFGKLAQLAMAQPFVEAAAFRSWPKLKGKVLPAAVAATLDPATHSDPDQAAAAAAWVHPLIDFVPPPGPHSVKEAA